VVCFVCQNKPRTIEALRANITEEIQAVTADVLARTFQNMARRVQSCLDANDGHFQDMLLCRHISHTTNVFLFKFRCNIVIDVRIIKEMPGSVASGTLCIPKVELQHVKLPSPYYSGMNKEERPSKEYLLCVLNSCEIKFEAVVFCFLCVPGHELRQVGRSVSHALGLITY
jgi:hypothetical protein